MVDADGNKISEAEKCCRYLNDPRRTGKLVGDTKHKHNEGCTHITSRAYGVTNFTKDNPIPLERLNPVSTRAKSHMVTIQRMESMKCTTSSFTPACHI
jgi:hypothetical protein